MAESGWLTRSFEHKEPYSLSYNGAIKPQPLKTAFLTLIDAIQERNTTADNESLLSYLLELLIISRDRKTILPAIPRNLSIAATTSLLDTPFHSKYSAPGAARLPVLALYAVYQCLFAEGLRRFEGKSLLPLESHNSADAQSGRIGDIDVVNADGSEFEAVEVKLDVRVTAERTAPRRRFSARRRRGTTSSRPSPPMKATCRISTQRCATWQPSAAAS